MGCGLVLFGVWVVLVSTVGVCASNRWDKHKELLDSLEPWMRPKRFEHGETPTEQTNVLCKPLP
jgi:hypothetical protein